MDDLDLNQDIAVARRAARRAAALTEASYRLERELGGAHEIMRDLDLALQEVARATSHRLNRYADRVTAEPARKQYSRSRAALLLVGAVALLLSGTLIGFRRHRNLACRRKRPQT